LQKYRLLQYKMT